MVVFFPASMFSLFLSLPPVNPQMGWRSWNLFGADVNQSRLEGIMDGMASRRRLVDGKPTSLCDLGYCDVGLDDNWQQCGSYGDAGYTYHTADGDPVVVPDLYCWQPTVGRAGGVGSTAFSPPHDTNN